MTLSEIIEKVNDLSYDDFPATIAGYKIRIEQDELTESPRNWGSDFTMVHAHRNYILGDERFRTDQDDYLAAYFSGMAGIEYEWYNSDDQDVIDRIHRWVDQNVLWLPLYLYDHSGITMRTSPFSCPWDSGMVGIIYITRENVRKTWKWKRITKKREKDIYKWMNNDVKTFDQYLRGEVYWFDIEYKGEHLDSCGGIYDEYGYPYTKSEFIIPAIKHHYHQMQQSRFDKIKTWIKNHVPLQVRQQELLNLAI